MRNYYQTLAELTDESDEEHTDTLGREAIY